jgi:N-acetylmuramoyl-L-alanine amidase
MTMKKIIPSTLLVSVLFFSGCAYHVELVKVPDIPLYQDAVTFNRVRYVPALKFCDYYDIDWNWDLVSQRIELTKAGRSVVFRPDSMLILVDGEAITLNHPVEYRNGAVYIPAQSAAIIAEEIFGLKAKVIPPEKEKIYRIQTVVIDPGHGGRDPGAISRYGTKEKDIVLDISEKLKSYLEGDGLTVYLTRDEDVFVPLNKRASIASKRNADLFISVHANASRRSKIKGFEVYYLSEASDDNARALEAAENASLKLEEGTAAQNNGSVALNPTACDLVLSENRRVSKELAYYICSISSDRLDMKKRGVKGARFVVLNTALMPAVLIEVGFLTNKREESALKKSSFRDKVAAAIANSILSYKREYERMNGFSR